MAQPSSGIDLKAARKKRRRQLEQRRGKTERDRKHLHQRTGINAAQKEADLLTSDIHDALGRTLQISKNAIGSGADTLVDLDRQKGVIRNIHRGLHLAEQKTDHSDRLLDTVESAGGQLRNKIRPEFQEQEYKGMKTDRNRSARDNKHKSKIGKIPVRRNKLVSKEQHLKKLSALDEIEQELDVLDEQAHALNTELKVQNEMLAECDSKITEVDEKFKNINQRMSKIVKDPKTKDKEKVILPALADLKPSFLNFF